MNKQEMTCKLLERTLDKLLKQYSRFQNNEIKHIELNGKKYKKINLSTYQLENAMHEYAMLEEKRQEIIIKANTLTKYPYSEMIKKAKFDMLESRESNLLDTDLDYTDLKYRFGVLAADYAKLKDKLKLYEKIIRKAELNKELENSGSKLAISINSNNKSKEKEILAELLELLSADYLINMSIVNGGCPEVYYENADTNKKICNFDDLKNLNIELNENSQIVQKDILNTGK